jgi:hypothetical protein
VLRREEHKRQRETYLEVNPCSSICTHNYLKLGESVSTNQETRYIPVNHVTCLVIPSVCTGPSLHTTGKIVSPTQKVLTKLGNVFRGRIIQAHDKKCIINYFKTGPVRAGGQEILAQCRPMFAIFCRQNAYGTSGHFGGWCRIRVGNDRL